MSAKAREKPEGELTKPEEAERRVVLQRHVMQALGLQSEPQTVQVRRLWDNRYRVNVFIGKDVVSARIAYSYFLLVNPDGTIIEACPAIAKQL